MTLSIIAHRLDQNTTRRASSLWLFYFGIFSAAVEFLEIFAPAFDGLKHAPFKLILVICSCFSLFQYARIAFYDLISKGPGPWIYLLLLAPPAYNAISGSMETAFFIMALEYFFTGIFASAALYFLFKKTRSSALKPLISYFFILLSIMSLKLVAPQILLPDIFGLHAIFEKPVITTVALLSLVGIFMLLSFGRYYVSQRNINEKVLELIPPNGSKYFFFFISALIIVVGWLSTTYVEQTFKAGEADSLLKRSRLVASSISGEALESLKWTPDDIKTDHYRQIKNMLISFRNANNDCRFISLMGFRDGKVYFLADSEPSNSKDYSPPGQLYAEIND
ncbi:MAG TPA: hypothetical protein PKK26_06660, partial [Candidatus Wallbacteria bacterium]|nr:hypothetical protein [Candidatus Wallbacteria bacterium]